MKRFWRTMPGKVTLFLGCLLGVWIGVGCAAWIAILWSGGAYTSTEKELRDQVIRGQMESELMEIRNRGEILAPLENLANTGEMDPAAFPLIADCTESNLIFEVTDPATGDLLACSGEMAEDGSLKQSGVLPAGGWSYSTRIGVRLRKGDVPGLLFMTDYEAEDVFPSAEDPGAVWTLVLLKAGLREGLPVNDRYALMTRLVHTAYVLRYAVYGIAATALLLALICFVALMCVSARQPDTEELVPGPFYRVPADILLCLAVVGLVPSVAVMENGGSEWVVVGGIVFLVTASAMGLGLAMSAAARIKGRTLFANTAAWRLLKAAAVLLRWLWGVVKRFLARCRRGLEALPMIPRTALAVGGISLAELILMLANYYETDNILLLWFLEKLILIPLILGAALALRRLQRAGRELAAGNLSWHTDTKGMRWALKEHAENLNHIAEGMGLAVEERMKSERMKTELITNVSHDIKTPLTSIINYARLIGDAAGDDPAMAEYSSVLLQQSERLKRLLEDLVEASKASTGNLEVSLAPCDPAIFVTQAAGEYEEKLEKAGLTLVCRTPERDFRIMADPRRMWRIFDNLMGNICKYAQSGTRVYLTLTEQEGEAEILFRNTSREALDISEEELMERFVRGDASRHTEGNGLGLSIAKSLAELQGGNLRIAIDGDLFKAILTFPILA